MKRLVLLFVLVVTIVLLCCPQIANFDSSNHSAAVMAFGPQEPPAKAVPKKETPSAEVALKIPPEEIKRDNPVRPGSESVAAGKHLFVTQCAMCHGAAGDGKGGLSAEMKLRTKDWTAPETLKDRTDGELFYILRKGHGAMPGQEGRMKDDQMWNLVNFIRSVAKKPGK